MTQCNIDSRGKAVRMIGGISSLLGSLILSILVLSEVLDYQFFIIPIIGALFLGLLSIWEARAGWCVVRGLGFKTPI